MARERGVDSSHREQRVEKRVREPRMRTAAQVDPAQGTGSSTLSNAAHGLSSTTNAVPPLARALGMPPDDRYESGLLDEEGDPI